MLQRYSRFTLRYAIGATPADEGPQYIVLVFISWFGAGAVLVAGYVFYLRAQAAQEEVRAAELRRGALETQQMATQLRLLQAQVEPHFLFNTLSNVRRLCQSDAVAGRAMLAQLTRYLRAALPRMRENETTLADEIDLVSAYLGVQKVRMGARLETSIDAPAPLLGARVPSMMLATLVENAIKHGIAPLPAGGSIVIAAREEHGDLLVDVTDTGRGFVETAGGGTGLANIRARLSTQFGRDGRLALARVEPHGVSVSIAFPLSCMRFQHAAASATIFRWVR